ncbi:helix-turn-helix domain-containing protein [Aureimonas sp. OT7]|uniref:helix-turn-helix domain-containing protein n=1 Tax=Aureimonas sp. OT7 TaxID=2816454 RepID=UPI00178397EC|nr:helix-turn-helix domain-containing protein [Aureimonas sp. OT7]QOG06550.1 helix-turn-helix domain-containing protein [Aureimonas sp. OT7]
MSQVVDTSLDLVWGIANIARLLGRTVHQTYPMLRDGQLPARQVGERWVVRRSEIEKFFTMDAA